MPSTQELTMYRSANDSLYRLLLPASLRVLNNTVISPWSSLHFNGSHPFPHQALHGLAPSYLSNLCFVTPAKLLHSADQLTLVTSQSRLKGIGLFFSFPQIVRCPPSPHPGSPKPQAFSICL